MQLDAKVFIAFLIELASLSGWLSGVSVAPSFVAVLMFALLQVLGHPHLLDEAVELDVG